MNFTNLRLLCCGDVRLRIVAAVVVVHNVVVASLWFVVIAAGRCGCSDGTMKPIWRLWWWWRWCRWTFISSYIPSEMPSYSSNWNCVCSSIFNDSVFFTKSAGGGTHLRNGARGVPRKRQYGILFGGVWLRGEPRRFFMKARS